MIVKHSMFLACLPIVIGVLKQVQSIYANIKKFGYMIRS